MEGSLFGLWEGSPIEHGFAWLVVLWTRACIRCADTCCMSEALEWCRAWFTYRESVDRSNFAIGFKVEVLGSSVLLQRWLGVVLCFVECQRFLKPCTIPAGDYIKYLAPSIAVFIKMCMSKIFFLP